jgi:ATP/maltotriose-dependent transcriptional regulator MalT
MLAGAFETAEHDLRAGYEVLEEMGQNDRAATAAALLARALLGQGRREEAEQFTETSERLADPSDLVTRIVSGGVRARLLAEDGQFEDAERVARETVALAEGTELVNFHADALTDLAAVLEADGRTVEASAATAAALHLYEQKGNSVAAKAARARLDQFAAV